MSKAAELAKLIGNINAGGGGVNRNVIINGAMNVAQRSTSETGLGANTSTKTTRYKTCDRWAIDVEGTTLGRYTMTQDSSAPSGFANSLKLDCTTDDGSIASGEAMVLNQIIEGQNVQAFAKGTSDAKPFAVSFYVKGNASATYVCELFDGDNSRHVAKTFSVTTDWTRVELSFPADTTGTFGDDTEASLYLQIWLHAGNSFNSGTLPATWASKSNANRAVGASSFFSSTSNTFFITGVQLEIGQNPTEFEHEPFETTRQKCLRYFEKKLHRSGQYVAVGFAYTTTSGRYSLDYESIKRANADVTFSGNISIYKNGNDNAAISPSSDQPGDITSRINIDLSSESMTAGTAFGVHADTDFSYLIDAEL